MAQSEGPDLAAQSGRRGRLAGKLALVTGASSGIGRAVAGLFAAEGGTVVAVARRPAIFDAFDGQDCIVPVQADINSAEEIEVLINRVEESLGTPDILCNIAGMTDMCHPLAETSDERWDAVLDLNLKAPFRLSRRVIQGMVARGSGTILNMGSLTAFRGLHGPSYCAAKAGLIGMTLSIAVGYANKGIRCNAINPGPVSGTQIGTKSGETMHVEGHRMALDILHARPVPLRCSPEDIAPTALFLCSDEARHVNGAIVAVDGGMGAC